MTADRWKRLRSVRALVHQAEELHMLQAQAVAEECREYIRHIAEQRSLAAHQSVLSLASGDSAESSQLRFECDFLLAQQGWALKAAHQAQCNLDVQREREQQARLQKKQMEQVVEQRRLQEQMEIGRAQQGMADESFLMLRSAEARSRRRQNSSV